MIKYILLSIVIILAGCTLLVPKSCEISVNGKCRELTPSERAGGGVRGHGQQQETTP